jgi:hypothetical protein
MELQRIFNQLKRGRKGGKDKKKKKRWKKYKTNGEMNN